MQIGRTIAAAVLSLLTMCSAGLAAEPKQGGILRIYHRDSPGSASIHEGATYSINAPFMPVFNNLVIYKQDVPREQPGFDRSRPRRKLGLERGQEDADLQIAAGRQVA